MSTSHGGEFAPGIHVIRASVGERHNALYLLVGEEACLLVDTGLKSTPADHILPYLRHRSLSGDRPFMILITHADVDHSGGAAECLARIPHAVLMCHELDRRWIGSIDLLLEQRYLEFESSGVTRDPAYVRWVRAEGCDAPVARTVVGGDEIRLGPQWIVRIVHTPGHTPGSVVVYDPRSRSVITGDAVLGSGIPDATGRPVLPPTYRDADAYIASVARIRALQPQHLLTSHSGQLSGRFASDLLGDSVSFAARVEGAIRDVLRCRPRPLREVVEAVLHQTGPWPRSVLPAFAMTVRAHMDTLYP